MSTLEANTIRSISGTSTLTIGESGDTITLTSGAKTSGFAKIGQVVSATKTDTFSSNSSSFVDLTDITVDITPSTTSSKILILCFLSVSATSGGTPQLKLQRDSTDIAIGDAAGSRGRVTASFNNTGTADMTSVVINFLDSPATTSSTTYKIVGRGYNTNYIYINRTTQDNDEVYRHRGVSTITAMEILD